MKIAIFLLALLLANSALAVNEFTIDGSGDAIIQPSNVGGTNLVTGEFVAAPSQVNSFYFIGGASGNGLNMEAQGSDTDISLNFTPKGAGHINFNTDGGVAVAIASVVSPHNYLLFQGGVAGSGPYIYDRNFTEDEDNVNLNFGAQGQGYFLFHSNVENTGQVEFEIYPNPNTTTNFPAVTSGGGYGKFFIDGSGNADLILQPLGTGKVEFGSYVGTTCAIGGYIQIKDSGGTVRKLAVCN